MKCIGEWENDRLIKQRIAWEGLYHSKCDFYRVNQFYLITFLIRKIYSETSKFEKI